VNFTKTGTHYFWFRGSDGGGNSINAGIDGDSPDPTMNNIDEGCCGTRLVPGGTTFTWIRGIDATPEGRSQFEIAQAGLHTINVWMREDGQIVDKFLITTDANFTPTGAGPDESTRVGENPPTISITSPTSGQAVAANGNVTVTVNAADSDGTVARVELFNYGVKIDESTTAPFSFTLTNVATGGLSLSARAFDSAGISALSAPVEVFVGNPKKVLYLHGATPTASDDALVARLRGFGFAVAALAAPGSQAGDATGKDLIVVSSTVASGDVVKFASTAVPIVVWESAVYDEYGFEATNVNGVTIASQATLEIVDATHPLAAGLSAGTNTVYTTAGDMTSLAAIVPSAKIVAVSTDGTRRPLIFAFETGDALNPARLATAPARRVGFFLSNNTFVSATDNGRKLFDSSVNWALGITNQTEVRLQIAKQGAGLVVSWAGGGTLESTTALGPGAAWTPVPNASSPHPVTPTDARRFYRVRM